MPTSTIILVNKTAADITLKKFGSIVVPASSQLDVTGIIYYPELTTSSELLDHVDDGSIVINNGVDELSSSQTISFMKPTNLIERLVTVGLSGNPQYTSIQDAIDAITVGANEKYNVNIAPGIYTENIVMKDGISLCGDGSIGDIIVYNTTGTVLTSGGGVGFPASSFQNIVFQIDATSTSIPRCVQITGGRNLFINCVFDIDISDGLINGIDITGGVNTFNQCSWLFGHTGTGGGAMNVINVSGASVFNIEGGYCSLDTDSTDTLDYVLFILDNSSESNKAIKLLFLETECSGNFDGHIGFWKVTGATTQNNSQSNRIKISCTGTAGANSVAYAYDVDSGGSSAGLGSIGNAISITGFTKNYTAEVDTTDTVSTNFDKITAVDGGTGAGTYQYLNSPSLGNFRISGSYFDMYAQTVVVAKNGGDFTTIQGAIDDITDAATGKRYVIQVYPGTYTENVDFTGKPYITLFGNGTREQIVITASSGTTLTVAASSTFECVNMTIQNTASTGGKAIVIPSGLNALTDTIVFSNCAIKSIINNGYGTTIEINSGRLVNIGGRIQYIHSGTGGGDHKLIQAVGECSIVSKAQLQTMSISDSATADNAIMINEDNVSVSTSFQSLIAKIYRAGIVTGETTFYYANGTSTDKSFIGNHIEVVNNGSGSSSSAFRTYGNGCSVSTTSNHIDVLGFTTNYAFNVAATDTVYSNFDVLDTSDEYTGAGDVVAVHAESNGDFHVTRDISLDRNIKMGNTSTFTAGGATIDEYSTDGTMGGNSDTAVPTEKALVTYVQGLASAYVKQDGTTPFTGAQAGISPTLGSHLTTKTYVDAAVSGGGVNDLGPFISRTTEEPLSPANGDKYIVPEQTSVSSESEFSESSGLNWDGHEDDVAEWNAVDGRWDFTTPIPGNSGWVNDEAKIYLFDGVDWIAQGENISHTALQDIGTNTHIQIDGHIASTLNPHTVTKTQVSLGNVTNDAQMVKAANSWSAFGEKTVTVDADIFLIEDSADSFSKKYVAMANIVDQMVKVTLNDTTQSYLANKVVGTADKITVTVINASGDEDLQIGLGTELVTLTDGSNSDLLHAHAHSATTGQGTDDHHAQSHAFAGADHTTSLKASVDSKISDASLISTLSGEIAAITEKASPVAADVVLIEDSAATNAKKRVQVGNLPVKAHLLGGTSHTADTKANLDAKVSNANLISTLGAEISTITEKTAPVAADLLLIEDSAATNAKKRIQIGNIPTSTVDTYTEKFESAGSTSNAGWTTVTTPYADSIMTIAMWNNTPNTRLIGIREVGSALNRYISKTKETSYSNNVKSDGTGQIQIYSGGSASVTFTIMSIME